jgi:hypothetical protein
LIRKYRFLAGLLLAFVLGFQAHAASEFKYKIPDGWRDIKAAMKPGSGVAVNNIPSQMRLEAISGRLAVAAVDPVGTNFRQASGTFNVVEAPGVLHATKDEMDKGAVALLAGFKKAGYSPTLVDVTETRLNDVPIGIITVDFETEEEERRVIQYFIPGRDIVAVLSYSAPKADFDRYLPVFEASVKATKGGYDHRGFNWKSAMQSGTLGALIFLLARFTIDHVRKRRDGEALLEAGPAAETAVPPEAPPRPSSLKASKYVWICPECGNPVPSRLDQCRCGGAKPA